MHTVYVSIHVNCNVLCPGAHELKAEEAARPTPTDPTRPPSPLVGPSGEPLEKPAAEKPQPVPLVAAASAIPAGLNQKQRKVCTTPEPSLSHSGYVAVSLCLGLDVCLDKSRNVLV